MIAAYLMLQVKTIDLTLIVLHSSVPLVSVVESPKESSDRLFCFCMLFLVLFLRALTHFCAESKQTLRRRNAVASFCRKFCAAGNFVFLSSVPFSATIGFCFHFFHTKKTSHAIHGLNNTLGG